MVESFAARGRRQLEMLAFIDRSENVMLLGPPGVGKTMKYAAILEIATDGRWGGYLPNLPGTGVGDFESPEKRRCN